MKILYHHRIASKDGQDVHIEEMIAAFRRQGHQVLLVGPESTANAAFGHDGGWVARLKRRLPRAIYELVELAYSIPAYRRLRRAYKSFQPDLLYERYNLNFLAGLWLKWRTGIRTVVEVNSPLAEERGAHDGLALRQMAVWSERAVWRGADLTLPVTGVLAGHLRQAGIAWDRILVIPNGIDRRRFPPRLDATPIRRQLGLDGKVVLGFIGFVREWHGLPQVVDAMAALGEEGRDLHLLVLGDGPALADLRRHAERRGLAERVSCLGLVGRDQVAAHIAAFDIALQPRVVAYASPLKLFEYMALGRAIIAPDQPNIREVLTDGVDSLLFAPGDAAAFRRCLRRLATDPALRRCLGQAAAAAIDQRGFTWDDNAIRVVAALGERA